MKKERYEISLWEDVLVGTPEHYEEQKIAIIGSNTMTAQFRAIEPRLVENINGTNTLTFKLYYTYIDNETGERVLNPFTNLMVNERKVKCFWKGEWYDLVIKGIQENSSDKTITYTCKDLYVNELSKTGFDLEFDNELQNNQGTVQELAEKVLEGTDWQLAKDGQDIIQQTNDEPLYYVKTLKSFTAKKPDGTSTTIPINAWIYVFYSVVQNNSKNCQFIYNADGNYQTDINSQLLLDTDCLSTDVTWAADKRTAMIGTTPIFTVGAEQEVSSDYRGRRLVISQKQEFDPLTGRYCYLYKDNSNREIYGIVETEYKDPTVVLNLISNAKEFTGTDGWIGENLIWTIYPGFDKNTDIETYKTTSYLKMTGNVFNTGIQNSIAYIKEGFQKNEKYIVRIKGRLNSGDKPSAAKITVAATPRPRICAYTESDEIKTPVGGTDYFSVGAAKADGDWIEFPLTCTKSITRTKILTEKMGFFLGSGSSTYWIEEVQLFQEIFGSDGKNQVRINPGEMDKQSVAQAYYKYYYKAQTTINADDIEYLYVGIDPWEGTGAPQPVYNDNFEKIRSITGKNSNRFNFLQNLAETFECFVKFSILHDEKTGKIKYYADNGAYIGPQKFVRFVKNVGQETGIGFVYGIDLRTISRSINSDQITSKVIVAPNNNEFAKYGSCEIALSKENYSKENFILNFDYYISQGLLSSRQLNKDLYLNTPNSLGYYYHLNQWNSEYIDLVEKNSTKKTELTKQESMLDLYNQYITSYQEQITSLKSEITQLAGLTEYNQSAVSNYLGSHQDDEKVKTLVSTLKLTENKLADNTEQRDKLRKSVEALKSYLENVKKRQDELIELIENIHKEFYKKYSRFIQEGSWTSPDYIDENLYYLDAQSVAYTSSRPQVSYDISVLRLSALDEFKNKVFHKGDISFIQDVEFFGYRYDGPRKLKSPYKEKVLISEVTSNFDSPEKDTFKVQNYKTRFEDLFQRITATTQSLQYASGEYQRAADAVEKDGTFNKETLANSIKINEDLVWSAQNENVKADSTGVTVTDKSDASKITKLTSGGVFISVDGGLSWKNAIRGEGIATQYLTAGSINTGNITILDGAAPSFRWDKLGLNAFKHYIDTDGVDQGINLGQFVRFDQYGIYGMNNGSAAEDYKPRAEYDKNNPKGTVWGDAQFGLTWRGFFLNNNDGSVQINSDDDIVVNDKSGANRIKIGRIDWDDAENEYVYGIRISDGIGQTVMETDSFGSLWLRNKLYVETYLEANSVEIGKIDTEETKNKDHGGRVISATNKGNSAFTVYEDGYMEAMGGTFTGDIYAKGGEIGGIKIENIDNAVGGLKRVEVHSKNGFSFKINSAGVATPKSLSLFAKTFGMDVGSEANVVWEGSKNQVTWERLGTGETFDFVYDPLKFDIGIYFIKASVEGKEHFMSITVVSDGSPGEKGDDGQGLRYEIESTNGYIFSSEIDTTVTARIYSNTNEIDADGKLFYTWYGRFNETGEYQPIGTGKTLTLDNNTDITKLQLYFECKEEGLSFSDNGQGTVTINDSSFVSITDDSQGSVTVTTNGTLEIKEVNGNVSIQKDK